MRHVFIAATAAAALSACGSGSAPVMAPPVDAPSATAFPDVFQTAYRAEASMTAPDGATISVVLLQDGPKARIEVPALDGPVFQVTDRTTSETVLWQHVRGRAILLPAPPPAGAPASPPSTQAPGAIAPPIYVLPDLWWQGDVAAAMSPIGTCALLGENGVEWERDRADATPQHVCTTADGVALWATDNGRTVWQLTSLQRGPLDPSQFEAPASARLARAEPEAEAVYDENAAYVPPYTPPQISPHLDPPAPQNQ